MTSTQVVAVAVLLSSILLAMCFTLKTNNAQSAKQLVRLAVIEVDTSQIKSYNEFLKEEIEASIRLEPGVITLYGIAEKNNPQRVTLFETYADSSQYKAHLETPHFQKYKQGTLQMVKHLDLIGMQPIIYHRKPNINTTPTEHLYIRLIKMVVDSSAITDFKELANDVMLPGIKNEPGVLVMYAASETERPTQVNILEVYADEEAYRSHINTTHFKKYKAASAQSVKSINFIDVDPICLGAK